MPDFRHVRLGKRLSAYILTLFAVEAAAMLGIIIQIAINTGAVAGDIGEIITVCGSMNGISQLMNVMYWVPTSVFELILMALSIYKAVQFWKETEGYSGFRLMNVLVRDQTVYFVL
ncbi:hypothetical protein EW145_g6658 [Phellinidium pouzarii]|uniref:Uncharacterized protein n=1 Tax=Phellinidium pouzarii TaxID=167371 RepID=A0A4S4KW22_9AGAM|nr:hypothetical protein EW145_g6658 [Phellinidium pouzarii]